VENIFKTRNVNRVYPRTGSPYEDGENLEDDILEYVFPEVEYAYGLSIKNPAFINNYRGVTFGVSFNF